MSIVNVVSYNVLSSSLCSPSHFVATSPAHCSSAYRLPLVMAKLTDLMDKNCIICLQEVSLAWASALTHFFAQQNYTFVVSNYGNWSNGYMGVGIAFPRARYTLAGVDITCVADTKPGGWRAPKPKTVDVAEESRLAVFTGWLTRLGQFFSTVGLAARKMAQLDDRQEKRESPWAYAASRQNRVVSLRLMPMFPEHEFVVSTYHMPCAFWAPSVMTIHAGLLMQHVQGLFGGHLPYIVAGDFNIKPSSPLYSLFTKGALPAKVDDPADPVVHGLATLPDEPCFVGDVWNPVEWKRGTVTSAYAEHKGIEPPFTNHAMTKGMTKPFTETLDYIFYGAGETKQIACLDVVDLGETCKAIMQTSTASLPTAAEGSDHLLIAAELTVERKE